MTSVEGLILRRDAINRAEEQRIISAVLRSLAFSPLADNRERSRVKRWGWDYSRPGVWMGPAPMELYPEDVDPEEFESVTVNEYLAGRGLGQHKDSDAFGDPILVLSLGAESSMCFAHEGRDEEVIVPVRGRDLMMMSGPARWEWTHGVEPCNAATRWSVVYRHRIDRPLVGA